jgi:hypothetical protein
VAAAWIRREVAVRAVAFIRATVRLTSYTFRLNFHRVLSPFPSTNCTAFAGANMRERLMVDVHHRIALNITTARASVYFTPRMSNSFVATITNLSFTLPVTRSWHAKQSKRADFDSNRKSPSRPWM